MRRLAVYAHYGAEAEVQPHVLYFLRELHFLQFEICFVSNSPLSSQSRQDLSASCGKIIERENTGLDFAMWQRGLADYEPAEWDELLLTNSSIVGPLQSLAPLWEHPALDGCDFWGLTDNIELSYHIQSFFLVFRDRVLRDPRFMEFWRSVLPFREKDQVIRSYEIGLTTWLQECGFKPGVIFPQEQVWAEFLRHRTWMERLRYLRCPGGLPGSNTSIFFPDVLVRAGMPFLKASVLREKDRPCRFTQDQAFELFANTPFPSDIVEELRRKEQLSSSKAQGFRAAPFAKEICAWIQEALLRMLGGEKFSAVNRHRTTFAWRKK